MRGPSILSAVILVSGLLAAAPCPATAQTHFGGQLSWANDFDFGVGGRVEVPLDSWKEGLKGIGSADFFFPGDVDVSYFELNAGLAYSFSIEGKADLLPYVGGGLNLARVSAEFLGETISDTEMGLNLLAGSRFGTGRLKPFAELRIELSGGEQFVLAAGILF